MLRHYAAMRDFDAFTAPSDYVREFYANYVWDPSFFNTLRNGVDSALFCPMEKETAKKELAEHVGDDRWDKTAQRIIQLFESLHKKRQLEREEVNRNENKSSR